MAWTWGTNTLSPGQSQRWWLWWPGYPGFEVIGVQCITAGAEVQVTVPGMQMNGDGSTTYFLTVTNASPVSVQYHFRGDAGPSWTWGTNSLSPGQTQRWWLWWGGYPGLELLGAQAITTGAEIRYTTPGVQVGADASGTYFITVHNASAVPVQYHFRGTPLC